MDMPLLAACGLLILFSLAIAWPLAWLITHWLSRPTVAGEQARWLAQTDGRQARRYRFWYQYGRLASRSRRVWAVGYRRFVRKLRGTIPPHARELADVFLTTSWETFVAIRHLKRLQRAHHRALRH